MMRRVILGLGLVVGAAAALACDKPVKLLWKYRMASGSLSTPLVTRTYVALGTETGLLVLELDGAKRCAFDAHGHVISAPKTDGTRIYFGSTNYVFYAVDANCQLVWKHPTRDRIKSDPWIGEGIVYTSSYDGHVYALDAETGTLRWKFPGQTLTPDRATLPADMKVGDFSYSSPLVSDGVLYVGNLDGHLYALDAATGALSWYLKTDAAVTSTPRIEDGVLYFGSNDGHIYAVSSETLKVFWRVATKDWVNSSARIVDGTLYIGSNDRHVYAIDTQSGEIQWRYQLDGPAVAAPQFSDGAVIAAGSSGDGSVYLIRADDQQLLWRFKTRGKIDADPVLVGRTLYVSSSDHHLYAFRLNPKKF